MNCMQFSETDQQIKLEFKDVSYFHEIENQDKTITANGTYTADSGYTGLGTVTVSIKPALQEKTATANGTVLPDAGYDGLSQVVVDVPVVPVEGDYAEDSIIDRSIAGAYVNDRVTSIGSNVFEHCGALTMVDFPQATSIGSNAFYYCTALTTVNFPLVTSIGSTVFRGCHSLTTVAFPNATSIDSYAFDGCRSLTTVDFPQATSIARYMFSGCSALTTANFPHATSVGVYAFSGCSSLAVLVLRNTESVCALSNSSAFNNTPFASGNAGGKLLVPAALVTKYQNATNWRLLYGYGHNKFLALEDYTVDGTTTGDIDWDKLNAA